VTPNRRLNDLEAQLPPRQPLQETNFTYFVN